MKRVALVALLTLTTGSGLFAVQLCTSYTNLTAAALQGLGPTGCKFGDKIFYNFTYSCILQDENGVFAGDADSPMVDASSVHIQFSNLGGNPLNPVVSFLGPWLVSHGVQGDIRLQYSVMAPPANAMVYSSLEALGFVSNWDPDNDFSSSILVAETVCCPGGNSVSLTTALTAPLTQTGPLFTNGGDGQAYAPATVITVAKDIFLDSGTGANTVTLTRIDQGLLEIPEPLSFVLFGSGLIAVGLLCMRRKRA